MTDGPAPDLAATAARGGVAALAAQAMKLVAGLGTMAVLGRLLTPDDFGAAALALATVSVLGRVKDGGLTTATIQRPDVTPAQLSTLFWLNAAVSVSVAALLLALAPVVGWFYADPRLVPLTAALAVVPLLDGLSAQHEALLSRHLRFSRLALIDTVAVGAGLVTAMTLAWRRNGPWSLVGQEIVYSTASAALVWSASGWRPGRPSRGSGVLPMVRFGAHLSGFRFLNYLALNLDTVFVGRFRGAAQAGLYDRAYRLLIFPFQALTVPLTAVVVPTLSRVQHDPARFRQLYRQWLHLAFGLGMPALVFLFVDAERAISVVLGSQWLPIVPIYRVLAPAAFLGKFNVITNWVYVSTGRADRQLRWSAATLLPMVLAYAIGVRWGAIGVAAGHTIVTCLLRYPSIVYCFKTAPVRPVDVLDVLRLPALTSLSAGTALWAVSAALPERGLGPGALLVDLVLFSALYLAAWTVLPSGRRTLGELLRFARSSARPSAKV